MVTAAMPTRMPNAVSAERSGRCLTARSASTTAVQTNASVPSFMTEGFHGFDQRSSARRQEPEHEPHEKARPDRDDDGRRTERHVPSEPESRSRDERPREREPRRAADARERHGFDEKLGLDVSGP